MSAESTEAEARGTGSAEVPSVVTDDVSADPSAAGPIILFDGICGLCNFWVDFVMARDRANRFRFAPLQGETAAKLLGAAAQTLSSVALVDQGQVMRKSDAVWRMLMILGGFWRFAGWTVRIVPRPLRDWGYDFIARRRYRWFGVKETCRLPRPDERDRFLP